MPQVQTASLPEALWGTPLSDGAQPTPAAKLIPYLATGIRFAPPPASAGASLGPFDPGVLLTPLGGGYLALQPGAQHDPMTAPVADRGSIQAICDGVASSANVQIQQAMVAVLGNLGLAPPTAAPLAMLGQQAGTLFAQPPLSATI